MIEGSQHSKESLLRMSKTQKGKSLSLEHRQRIGAALRGLKRPPRSEEHRRHLSEALKGRIISEQWRKRIGEASKRRRASEETKRKISRSNFGKKRSEASKQNMRGIHSGQWKGGINHHNGYIKILRRDHPFHSKKNYVAQHRLVIERLIGRYLLPRESVHHVNKIRDDNRPENLMAFVNESAHQNFEKAGKFKPDQIIFDGRLFKH